MAEAAQSTNNDRELPYVRAITEGVREVLLEQEHSFVAGEDVAGAGSVYGYYAGLLDEFGDKRIIDTPISEEAIVGLGVGAAATGCRPIIIGIYISIAPMAQRAASRKNGRNP